MFSRELATQWRDRVAALIDNDWLDASVLGGLSQTRPPQRPLPDLSRAKIEKVCARPEAPAWILAWVKSRGDLPADVEADFWRAPPMNLHHDVDGREVWDVVQDVAVIECEAYRIRTPI